jgi:hypothetical protein
MTIYDFKSLKKRLNKYKIEYILFILVGLSMEAFIRYTGFSYDVKKEESYSNLRRKLYKKVNGCFFKSDNQFLQKFSHFVKGEKYFVQMSLEENTKFRKECITTNWNITHFLSHLVVVFLFPHFYREIFVVTFLYEIYEYYGYKCHDISDIAYNVSGLLLGYKLRKLYDKII